MTELPHSLTRAVRIHAPRDVVFRYFTDSARFAAWWGKGSTIDGRVGGQVRIVYPGDVIARGTVTAFQPNRRIAFTYGYESAHPELPPGDSLVTIELDEDGDGTCLRFRHDLATEALRDMHRAGWRYQLSVFANVVADATHAGAAAAVDQWFAAWAEPDAARRLVLLQACTTNGVAMQDRYSCVVGRDDLNDHITNVHVHMPSVTARRTGDVRHCQGTLLVAWTAADAAGAERGHGTNVVRIAPDGRIAAVVGFW